MTPGFGTAEHPSPTPYGYGLSLCSTLAVGSWPTWILVGSGQCQCR
jgi:hypothetical protein